MSRVSVDLHGKVAFITGGGSGIGRSLALQMALDGAAVTVTDLDEARAIAVAGEIEAAGGQALGLRLDVRDAEAAGEAVAAALARFGQIDFLFANAGVLGPAEYLDITPADWDLSLDVNIKGVVHTCRAVVPHMMERRQGRILITASYNGVRAGSHVIPYRVTKAATIMYARCLALVLAPYGVTVNALCPGVTLTPMQVSYAEQTAAQRGISTDAYLEERLVGIPMHEFTGLADITGLAEFLVSDSARLITGQAIAPDGGVMTSS